MTCPQIPSRLSLRKERKKTDNPRWDGTPRRAISLSAVCPRADWVGAALFTNFMPVVDSALAAVLSPFFSGGSKHLGSGGIIRMAGGVTITPALLQVLFGTIGEVLPMRLEHALVTALDVKLGTQEVILEELHLLLAPHDPPGLAATRDDVDRAIRRLIELVGPVNGTSDDPPPPPPGLGDGRELVVQKARRTPVLRAADGLHRPARLCRAERCPPGRRRRRRRAAAAASLVGSDRSCTHTPPAASLPRQA